ncbi:MAG: hypothetical protein FWH20_06025 [Oscillospiraceae bacterium]|nr:hypothetical protein [Oscillospiraceae bacterium]
MNYISTIAELDLNPATGVDWTSRIIVAGVLLAVLIAMGVLSKVLKNKKSKGGAGDSKSADSADSAENADTTEDSE